jgi:hypothetical protein
VPLTRGADYAVVMTSDDERYGGQGLVKHMNCIWQDVNEIPTVKLYLPARTVVVLEEMPVVEAAPKPKRTRKAKAEAPAAEEAPKPRRTRKTKVESAE